MIARIILSAWLTASAISVHAIDNKDCTKLEIPRGSFIYLANSDLKRIKTKYLEIGEINLPQKQDISFFLITSNNLVGDMQTGRRDVSAEIRKTSLKCKMATVSEVFFSFGSPLPPGRFVLPYPIFARNSDGFPEIGANPQNISGSIRRVWVQAAISDRNRLTLKNDGNISASKFEFPPLSDALVRILHNHCSGISLGVGESCDIIFDFVQDSKVRTQDWRVEYSDSEDFLDIVFSVENSITSVIAINKFYE